MDAKQLTVGELIVELQKFNPEAVVWTEGCDCWGECSGVEVTEHYSNPATPAVLLNRLN